LRRGPGAVVVSGHVPDADPGHGTGPRPGRSLAADDGRGRVCEKPVTRGPSRSARCPGGAAACRLWRLGDERDRPCGGPDRLQQPRAYDCRDPVTAGRAGDRAASHALAPTVAWPDREEASVSWAADAAGSRAVVSVRPRRERLRGVADRPGAGTN